MDISLIQPILLLLIQLARADFDIKNYLETTYENRANELCALINYAKWDFDTDLTNQTKEELFLNASLISSEFERSSYEEYFRKLDPEKFNYDEKLKREVIFVKKVGDIALDEEELTRLKETKNSLVLIYGTAKICPYGNQTCDLKTQGLSLTGGVDEIFYNSSDYDERAYIWTAWRNATGFKLKDTFKIYVNLSNNLARLNGYSDLGSMWRDEYDSNFVEILDSLWDQVEPLYSELHKYVARKLKNQYGEKIDITDGLIPANLFDDLWAIQWRKIGKLVEPFPDAEAIDIDGALLRENYTVLKMFETADEFYQSMGLPSNNFAFDAKKGALIEKPEDDGKEIVCHPTSWTFCRPKSYRVKICAKVSFRDFAIIHHELGHIEYFQLYENLSFIFRRGANPAFHEAIGDTIALSVTTPKHLKKIGLLKNAKEDDRFYLNSLMTVALDKVALLPFALLVDKWRWDVFSGNVTEDKWNSHWVELRKKYQKLKPPVPRSDDDFDPGSVYHVAADSQVSSYFVAHILQFQLYKGLCIAAGEYDPNNKTTPLSRCDFYQSVEAGNRLRAGLSLGSSQNWSDVLEAITGERELNASALLEYFDPLFKFLKEKNAEFAK